MDEQQQHRERECPACGGQQYRAVNESMFGMASLRGQLVWRHEATGYIACAVVR